MIAVDTSVIIAILMAEPDRDELIGSLADHFPTYLSAVSLQEAGMVMRSRRGSDGVKDLVDLLSVLRIQVVPYDEPQARLAIEAFSQFGKGMGSGAKLNMGDCATYALAKSMNVPLLFKGDDFTATDIASVL